MWLLAASLLAVSAFALGSALLGSYLICARPRPPTRSREDLPPISILKPLRGLEPGLEDNLRSFLTLNYPHYELILCIAGDSDPCLPMVKRLLSESDRSHLRLQVGESAEGINPKVNNLLPAYRTAKHDLILISDSNVRVGPEYLTEVASAMTDGVGVVTALVAGVQATGVGGRLEATYLNTFVARWTAIAALLRQPCVIGKSMLFRRSVMERLGGLKHFGQYVNEDYMTGLAMHDLGLRTVVMHTPVSQYVGACSFKDFWLRHVRWGRLRRVQFGPGFYLEPVVFYALGSGFVGALGISHFYPMSGVPFFVGYVCLWAVADLLLMHRMGSPISIRTLLAWCGREALAIPHWLHMALGRTVEWRGNRLCIATVGCRKRSTVTASD